jgi:hypothetical protein
MHVGRRLDALAALIHFLDIKEDTRNKIISSLNSFNQESTGLSKKRNRYVHDTWSIGQTTKKTYRLEITAEKRPVFEFKENSAEDIINVAVEIQKLRWKYNAIEQRIFEALPPSTEIHL